MLTTCSVERMGAPSIAPPRGRVCLALQPLLLAFLLPPALAPQQLRASSLSGKAVQRPMSQATAPGPMNGETPPSQAMAPTAAQRSVSSFQNDFLRVEATSAVRAKAKNRLTLSLVFQNISTQDVLLAMSAGTYNCRSRIVDSSGVVVPTQHSLSNAVLVTGLECINGGEEYAVHYARLSPGARTPIVITFEADSNEKFEGDTASFSAALLRLTGDTYSRFTVGLTDIKVQN